MVEYAMGGIPADRVNDGSKRGEGSSLIPNSFQVPNTYVDRLMPLLTPEEFKVLIYVDRRILGFGKRRDRIALRQLVHGVTDKQGRVLDQGTGLGEKTAREVTHSLLRFGVLVKTAENDPHRNEGPELALQLDQVRIDWEGLEERKREWDEKTSRKMASVRDRRRPPVMAQQGVSCKDPVLSHNTTPPVMAQQAPPCYGTTDTKPRETQGNPEGAEHENEVPAAPAKVERHGNFQVQVFEPVATAAPTLPQRQPVPLEASNRRCEPDPREEPKAVTLGKACDDAIFLYCDKAGYLKWIDRLKVYAAKFRDERGIPEAVLIGLLPQAAERGRKLWSEHDHGQHGPRPIFLNRLEEGLADAVNLWQQEQRAEANRREAAEKARKREAAPAVDHAEEFRRHMDALVEAGPGSPEWEAITSKTERDIVRQRYRQRHPDQWVAYLERQAAQMQAQRAGAHS